MGENCCYVFIINLTKYQILFVYVLKNIIPAIELILVKKPSQLLGKKRSLQRFSIIRGVIMFERGFFWTIIVRAIIPLSRLVLQFNRYTEPLGKWRIEIFVLWCVTQTNDSQILIHFQNYQRFILQSWCDMVYIIKMLRLACLTLFFLLYDFVTKKELPCKGFQT